MPPDVLVPYHWQSQHRPTLLLGHVQGRKQERAWKQAADEHATAVLAVESRLAGKQREVAGLQDLNSRLFSRFQGMRDLLARNEEKLSHDKLRGRQHLSTMHYTCGVSLGHTGDEVSYCLGLSLCVPVTVIVTEHMCSCQWQAHPYTMLVAPGCPCFHAKAAVMIVTYLWSVYVLDNHSSLDQV